MTQYSLLVLFKCVRPVYILTDVFDRKQGRWQLVFAELFLYKRNKKRAMRQRSVDLVTVFFRKIQRFLICHSSLFSASKTVTVSTTLKFSTLISSADLTD